MNASHHGPKKLTRDDDNSSSISNSSEQSVERNTQNYSSHSDDSIVAPNSFMYDENESNAQQVEKASREVSTLNNPEKKQVDDSAHTDLVADTGQKSLNQTRFAERDDERILREVVATRNDIKQIIEENALFQTNIKSMLFDIRAEMIKINEKLAITGKTYEEKFGLPISNAESFKILEKFAEDSIKNGHFVS